MTGEKVRELLKDKKIQQKEIAAKLGMSTSNLGNQLDKDDIRTGLLEKISEAAGIPIAEFYGEGFGVLPNISDKTTLELLKAKDEQLTMAMQQTSAAQAQTDKALAQMDRVIGALQVPRSAPVHIADIAADFAVLPPTTPKVNSCIVGTRSSTKRPARNTGKLTISRHKGPNSEID